MWLNPFFWLQTERETIGAVSYMRRAALFLSSFFLVFFFFSFNSLKASFFLLHAHSALPQGAAFLKQLLHHAEMFCKQEMSASLKQLFVGYRCSGKLEVTCSCTAHPSGTAGEPVPDWLSVSCRSCSQCCSKLAESHGWDPSLAGWFPPLWFYTLSCCCLFLMDSGGTIPASAASPLPVFPA